MLNNLLIAPTTVKLLIEYGVYVGLILIGLIAIAVVKGRTKGQLKPQTVKTACLKAKKAVEEAVDLDETKLLLLGHSKLMKIKNSLSNATWTAFQIVEAKKDIVFEGIANNLNGAADCIMKTLESGFIAKTEYDAVLKDTISALDGAIAKIDAILTK